MKKSLVAFLLLCTSLFAIEHQELSAYQKRRQALAEKATGAVLLFAPTESEGPNAIYGFRQDDNFFYLTGVTDPGAAVLIAPASKPGEQPEHGYIEILFLPGRNVTQEKWTGPKLTPETPDATGKTGFQQVAAIDT